MTIDFIKTDDGRTVFGESMAARDLANWHATVPQIRDAILAEQIVCMDRTSLDGAAPAARDFLPTTREHEATSSMAVEAITSGRVIDFGHIPQTVIKDGGIRGGRLWNEKAIPMPFMAPWLFYHTWDGTDETNPRGLAALYLVNSLSDDPYGPTEVIELQPTLAGLNRVLIMGDRAILLPDDEAEPAKYHCHVAPAVWRFMRLLFSDQDYDPFKPVAGNVFDPLMTCLMMWWAIGVPRATIEADAKLQRARAKRGKPAIPPFTRVDSEMYVTILSRRGQPRLRGADQGGTHASPVPHLRSAHRRTYGDKVRFFPDTLVNVAEDVRAAFKSGRSHYAVRS